MGYLVNIKKVLLIAFATMALTACATQKKVGKQVSAGTEVKGDVYAGQETVEYLATGVPDRVFFATNKSVLTTAAREIGRASCRERV